MGARARRGDARRDRIIAVAFQEFAANGYRGASLARIAEGAGLTQAGLLHHFKGKADLLIEVLRERDERDGARVGIDLEGVTPWRRVLDDLRALVEYNSRAPGLVQLFTVLNGEAVTDDHPAREWARERYRRLVDHADRSFKAGVEAGELRPDLDTLACAQRLFAVMDGLQQQWLLDLERVDMPHAFGQFLAEVERSITA
ncbi:TetR/AcrR family transcriptional regulator [Actinokineospora auranticolor]|uniref:AcrR family transcriptional regulator n=1 Tax=Actinokineospora auranticolor TaxID=155976 RepID=A0A2S6GEH3_9PSEU|nr:TetR/AcrR family transcriptional regulator [Actinokineospora auranticolor]PPK63628.1 AcrR family transcriptional regulator [Actinokineospora auranticolor]